jgi:hypothetical protein
MKAPQFGSLLLLLLFTQIGHADPLDDWTWHEPSSRVVGVAFGSGRLVAVGYDGQILSSTDGANWIPSQSGVQYQFSSIAYGNGQFLAVGGSDFELYATGWNSNVPAAGQFYSVILSSPDGITWDVRQMGFQSYRLTRIVFGGGQFVAHGLVTNGQGSSIYQRIFTSTDGVVWAPHEFVTKNSFATIDGMTYGNGLFVAVGGWHNFGPGSGSTLLTSTDASNWVERKFATSNVIYGVTFGKGQFVGVTGRVRDPLASAGLVSGSILTSSDGTNWVERVSDLQFGLRKVAFGNGEFVAMGDAGITLRSSDGLQWVQRPAAAGPTGDTLGYGPVDIVYGHERFIAVGYEGGILQSRSISILRLSLTPIIGTELFSLSLEGPTAADYTIQSSTDLKSWRDVTKIAGSPSGIIILDVLPVMSDRQFYRATSP